MTNSGLPAADAIRCDVPIPFYYQLTQLLQDAIQSGAWATDEAIPSEHELCQTFGVSRTVVRQALGGLVAAGILYRVRGKGTFVAPRKLEEKFVQRADGFYTEMTASGLTVVSDVLEQEPVAPPPRVRKALGLDEQARTIRIDRLRSVGGPVLLYVQTFIPEELCPDLVNVNLERRSLYALLRERYGLVVASGKRSIEAVLAGPPISELLKVRKGAPLLKIESVSYLADGRPLEY